MKARFAPCVQPFSPPVIVGCPDLLRSYEDLRQAPEFAASYLDDEEILLGAA